MDEVGAAVRIPTLSPSSEKEREEKKTDREVLLNGLQAVAAGIIVKHIKRFLVCFVSLRAVWQLRLPKAEYGFFLLGENSFSLSLVDFSSVSIRAFATTLFSSLSLLHLFYTALQPLMANSDIKKKKKSRERKKKMQPVTSSIGVDSYNSPSVNVTYKRANGEVPLSVNTPQPVLPALLRLQFVVLSNDDLRGLERRIYYQDRAAQRDNRIEERAARVAAQSRLTAEQREAKLRQHAARHAKVDGEVRVKQIQEEYRTIGMR